MKKAAHLGGFFILSCNKRNVAHIKNFCDKLPFQDAKLAIGTGYFCHHKRKIMFFLFRQTPQCFKGFRLQFIFWARHKTLIRKIKFLQTLLIYSILQIMTTEISVSQIVEHADDGFLFFSCVFHFFDISNKKSH